MVQLLPHIFDLAPSHNRAYLSIALVNAETCKSRLPYRTSSKPAARSAATPIWPEQVEPDQLRVAALAAGILVVVQIILIGYWRDV